MIAFRAEIKKLLKFKLETTEKVKLTAERTHVQHVRNLANFVLLGEVVIMSAKNQHHVRW